MAVTLLFVFMTVAGLANGDMTIKNKPKSTLHIEVHIKDDSKQLVIGTFILASGEEVSMELESCGGDMSSANG
jgi:hypothetical protein